MESESEKQSAEDDWVKAMEAAESRALENSKAQDAELEWERAMDALESRAFANTLERSHTMHWNSVPISAVEIFSHFLSYSPPLVRRVGRSQR